MDTLHTRTLGDVEMLIERIVNTLVNYRVPEPRYRGETIKIHIVMKPLTVHEINSDTITRNPEYLTLIAQEWAGNGGRFLKWEFLSVG